MNQIELDNHPKKDVIAELLFPTKKETAEHYPVCFHSIEYNAWFVFKPSIPQSVQNMVVRLVGG